MASVEYEAASKAHENDKQRAWEPDEPTVLAGPVPAAVVAEDFQQLGTPEQLGKLYGALAKAQGAFAPVVKSKEVDFNSKTAGRIHFHYATLSDIDKATRPALAANALAIFQPFTVIQHGKEGVIRTVLAHADGAQIVSLIRFLPNADIKQLGGTVTYLRRYAKNAILGTDGDEDADDIPTGDQEAPQQRQATQRNGRAERREPPTPPAKSQQLPSVPPNDTPPTESAAVVAARAQAQEKASSAIAKADAALAAARAEEAEAKAKPPSARAAAAVPDGLKSLGELTEDEALGKKTPEQIEKLKGLTTGMEPAVILEWCGKVEPGLAPKAMNRGQAQMLIEMMSR